MYKHIKTLLYFYNAEYIFNNYIDKNLKKNSWVWRFELLQVNICSIILKVCFSDTTIEIFKF